jgi:hypothetical protein
MYSVRIDTNLGNRLDAEFYHPEALDAIQRISQVGKVVSLGEEIVEGYRVVYHGTDSINGLDEEQTLKFLSPTQISSDGEIDFDNNDLLPIYYREKYPKGLAISGELLIEVKGNVSKVAVIPEQFPNNLMISGSLFKAKLSDKLDSRFVLAFLKSKYGQLLKNRLTSNTIINYIGKDDLYSIPVLVSDSSTQTYIGDKVRQAEQLRAWARHIEFQISKFHGKYIPIQSGLDFKRKTRRVTTKRLTDRFDAHFYPGVVEDYMATPNVKFELLSKLIVSNFNGQTQDECQSGIIARQITVTNLSKSFVKGMPRLVEKPSTNMKFTQQHDILMCNAAHNKSYIGRELTYVHGKKPLLPSTEVMVIRTNRDILPASYLRHYLLTKLGFVQLQSTIRGITAHSYPVDVAKLDIPIPEVPAHLVEEWFACDVKLALAGKASELASKLTLAATKTVEALIEGKIIEDIFVSAQLALDAGDNSQDRDILSRLTAKGLDSDGDPLFSDLDQLYDLLEKSQLSEE